MRHDKKHTVPGDSVVHQTLLQGIGQPLVHQRVTDEGSTLTQRGLELEGHQGQKVKSVMHARIHNVT